MSRRGVRRHPKSRRKPDHSKKLNHRAFFEALEDRRLLAINLSEPPRPHALDRHELVIVDTATPDYGQLAGGLRGVGVGKPDILFLDTRADGVLAISRILSQRSDLDAVHILSHGEPGAVHLGSAVLSSQTLPTYADLVRGWSAALKGGADILLYGCNLAGDDAGQGLVIAIHELTGADVAASTDATGNAALGGN